MPLDRDKLIRVVGMTGSEHDGECLAAARRANALLTEAETTWAEVLAGEDPIAVEACRQLLADLEAAHTRIAELERASPEWRPVERAEIGNHNRTSKWLIELNQRGEVWFSEKEREFINSCRRWIGTLRPKMREWLQEIVNRTAQRYGLVPPPP